MEGQRWEMEGQLEGHRGGGLRESARGRQTTQNLKHKLQ